MSESRRSKMRCEIISEQKMSNRKTRSYLIFVFRIFIGAIFAFSGFMKLISPSENFLSVILNYQLISGPPAVLLSKALPWIEFIGGVFFALGLYTRHALFTLWALSTVFIIALSSVLIRGISLDDCGCFSGMSLSVPQTLAADIFFWSFFAWSFFIREIGIWQADNRFKK